MRKIVINITLRSSIHIVLTKFSTLSSIPYPPSIDYLAEIRLLNGMPSGISELANSIIPLTNLVKSSPYSPSRLFVRALQINS